MVQRKTWVSRSGNFGSDLGSVFDGSRSLVFLRFLLVGVLDLSFLSFHLVFRSRIFQSSWLQLMELNL